MPKVSVILTNYNHGKYLKKRIESVLAQTYTDYSIIIYDDCSTDNSRDIIEHYRHHPKVEQIVYNAANSGNLYKQWEKGIANATGDWIWIAQSDDYAGPGFLESLIKLARQYENTGIAFCNSYWINDNDETGPDLSLYHDSFFRSGIAEIKLTLARQCSIQNASAAIIRRDVAARAINGISEYAACGDWIFYLKILHCCNIVYTDQRLNYFRWYHANISNAAKNKGTWIYEGITVLNNIDYNKVRFSPKEFYLVIRWWAAIIFRSDLKNKFGLYKTLISSIAKQIFSRYVRERKNEQ